MYSSLSVGELIRACTETGAPEAWEDFVRRFHPTIALAASRTAGHWGQPSAEVVDDLVQETFLKICAGRGRLLREFEWRRAESLPAFIKVVTANVVHDYFKALYSQKRGAGRAADELDEKIAPATPPGGAGNPQNIEREILLKEIDQCLVRHLEAPTSDRDRMVFWFYYRHGMTAQAIAALPQIELSVKGVESLILRLTRLVRSEMAEAESQPASEKERSGKKGIRAAESL